MFESAGALKSYFTCWGYDSEWELTIDVYEDRIVWLLELDPQWSDPPRKVVQTHEQFLGAGPPHGCTWGLAGGVLEEVREFVQAVNRGRAAG